MESESSKLLTFYSDRDSKMMIEEIFPGFYGITLPTWILKSMKYDHII